MRIVRSMQMLTRAARASRFHCLMFSSGKNHHRTLQGPRAADRGEFSCVMHRREGRRVESREVTLQRNCLSQRWALSWSRESFPATLDVASLRLYCCSVLLGLIYNVLFVVFLVFSFCFLPFYLFVQSY